MSLVELTVSKWPDFFSGPNISTNSAYVLPFEYAALGNVLTNLITFSECITDPKTTLLLHKFGVGAVRVC